MDTISMLPRHIEIQLVRYIFDVLQVSADSWNWLDPKDKLELMVMAAKELDITLYKRIV